MTTIILVIVGILLASAAALMVIWYGGDSFDTAATKADAAAITSHLDQIKAAVDLYEISTDRKVQPGSLSFLVPYYMTSLPRNPVGDNWYYDTRMEDASQPTSAPRGVDLAVAGLPMDKMGTALCTAIAKQHGTLGSDGAPIVSPVVPKSLMGCFNAHGWGGLSGIYVTYVRLR